MYYINELREGEMINAIYFCKTKQALQTKAGKNYYSMLLQDKTGTIDAKIWDLNNGIAHFEAMDYIAITAQVVSFQNNLQLNVKQVRKAQEGEYSVGDYMPCSEFDSDKMYRELVELMNSVKDPYLHQLLDGIFVQDKAFTERFKTHSAAKSIHHGFIGGLLQHTLAVTKLCDFYAAQYPVLNRDLLLTAAICHDLGKVEELSEFPENDYTDEGQLVGHIVMCTIMLDRKMKEIEGFPVKLGNELKHCVLAHHGELEFGSPKKPALIEALALSFADNTDAKMQIFIEELKKNDSGSWMGYNRNFESNLRATSKPNV
ncbi:MAG: HD domain-containing protein [Bacteroides sp.]|nr:HD domain-containing protein [Bacteroides sp.]MCM1548908.1 HD domain-containing protein [Clostridium sp.]